MAGDSYHMYDEGVRVAAPVEQAGGRISWRGHLARTHARAVVKWRFAIAALSGVIVAVGVVKAASLKPAEGFPALFSPGSNLQLWIKYQIDFVGSKYCDQCGGIYHNEFKCAGVYCGEGGRCEGGLCRCADGFTGRACEGRLKTPLPAPVRHNFFAVVDVSFTDYRTMLVRPPARVYAEANGLAICAALSRLNRPEPQPPTGPHLETY